MLFETLDVSMHISMDRSQNTTFYGPVIITKKRAWLAYLASQAGCVEYDIRDLDFVS